MPLITNQIFLDLLADQRPPLSERHAKWTAARVLERVHLNLRARRDAPAYRIQNHAQFANLRNHAILPAANNWNVMREALSGTNLIELMVTLQGLIDDRAGGGGRSLIEQYLIAAPPGDLDNPTAGELDALYANAPDFLARHAINTMADQFEHNIIQICDRVFADWRDIGSVFFPAMTLRQLSKITVLDSDPHKGGHRVVCLEFKAIPNNPPVPRRGFLARFRRGGGGHNVLNVADLPTVKLIYKPGDLEIDYRITGDTAHVRANVEVVANLPVTPQGSLFELFNTHGNFNPPLPTYPILPRNCGSQLIANGAGDFDFSNTYGYLKFLSHEPKRAHGNDPGYSRGAPILGRAADDNVRRLRDYADAELDWITHSQADVTSYFQTMAYYMAIGICVGFQDSHQGNVMVSGKRPYLIDLEVCMKSEINNVFSTMLPSALERCTDAHNGRFYSHLYYAPSRWRHNPRGQPVGHGVYLRNGTLRQQKDAAGWGNVMAAAFDQAIVNMRGMHAHLDNWIQSAELGNTFTRITVEATSVYFGYRDRLFGSANCLNPVPDMANFASPTWNSPVFQRLFRSNTSGGVNGWVDADAVRAPRWCTQRPEHNFSDLVQMDIPAYYHRIGTRDLYNTRGRLVPVVDAGIPIPAGFFAAAIAGPLALPRDFFGNPADVDDATFLAKTTAFGNYLHEYGPHYFRECPAIFVRRMINRLNAVPPDPVFARESANVQGYALQIGCPPPVNA